MQLFPLPGNELPDGMVAGSLKVADGTRLRYALCPGPRLGHGTVCIFQGRGDFIERYFETIKDLQEKIAEMHDSGRPALFSFSAGPDLKDSNVIIVQGFQGGLSLPNRDYYTKDDAKSAEIRAKFVEYMTGMFKLLGDSPEKAAANARTVMDMQTRLAKASLTPVESRNPDNRYNKISLTAAQELTPAFSWQEYLHLSTSELTDLTSRFSLPFLVPSKLLHA